ncbi:Uncharacterised protein [Collinsella aerofaciens]|nr:Uncharacterised protein [Collinsella aerofaciens]
MAGDVDGPMPSRSLAFIMSLVLRGGMRIIYDRSSDTDVFAVIDNPSVGGTIRTDWYNPLLLVIHEFKEHQVFLSVGQKT